MKTSTFLLAGCLMIAPPYVGIAQEAPFGLQWGATPEEVRSLGAELKVDGGKQFGASFSVTKLPKALADQEGAFLSFGFNNRLWRITAFGKAVENEPHGATLKSRYGQLLEALMPKYGAPTRFHSLGGSIYREPRYFIAGIRTGDSHWYSDFTHTGVFLQVGIVASGGTDGRWRMIFEEKKLREQFEIDKKNEERNTL